MPAIVTAILTLLATIAPSVTGSSAIASIIATLEQILPTIASLAPPLWQVYKNVIAALKTNGEATPEQIATLQALDAQADARFEAAATKAEAEDAADAAAAGNAG